MDFLKIREKAKARAAEREARGREEAGAPAPDAPPGAPPAAPADLQAAADAEALEGELAARLQALPPAEDPRFTTWRPGSGAPPVVAPAPPVSAFEPRREDFTLVAPLAGGAALPATPAPAPDPLDEFFYREGERAPEVPVVGAASEAARAPGEDAAREEYLTFSLGDEEYAVPIERVREVMRSPPITEVPGAPSPILGVVTVRGEVVAVFEPRRRLGLAGLAPAAGLGRVVIVDAGEGPCGLLVDGISSVVRLRPGSIEPRPQGIGGPAAECLAGIGRQGERLFTVLDLVAFFRRPAATPRAAGDEEDRHAGA